LHPPAIAKGLNPAPQVQCLVAEAGEVEVKALALPFHRSALYRQGAMGLHIAVERERLVMGWLLRQQIAQWAGDLQDAAVGIQVQMQTQGRRAKVIGQVGGGGWRAFEQTPEEFVPRIQN